MTSPHPPRILVVDDEEAILETMTFTFADSYEVLTSSDAHKALELLDENDPVAVVITDQRMPDMTGVEFLTEVVERHPQTVRIILTGFADMEATIQAINDGHVYAYVNKPWEPDQLKQVVKRAVEHHLLATENTRLVEDLRRSMIFLEAVMDRLDTGAIAIDSKDIVQAANRPARQYLNLKGDPRGQDIGAMLAHKGLEQIAAALAGLAEEKGRAFEDLELAVDGTAHRLRVTAQTLVDQDASTLGRVILFREVSHEPLRRRFEEIVSDLSQREGELRPQLEVATEEMEKMIADVEATGITSPGMAELSERGSRTQTAIQNWLDVDDLMAREEVPDAQILMDRMRIATQRWPQAAELPARVRRLAERVEAYYESGENSKQRVL